jgi:hypothetical protein
VPSTYSLDPRHLLKLAGHSLSTTMVCPVCRAEFRAISGATFPASYKKGEEVCHGPMLFCSTACVLGWFDPQELGYAQ